MNYKLRAMKYDAHVRMHVLVLYTLNPNSRIAGAVNYIGELHQLKAQKPCVEAR